MSEEKKAPLAQLAPADAARIANDVRAAMKGFGTDEAQLIASLTPLNSVQAQQVLQAYKTNIKRDLLDDIKDETRGNLENLLVSLLTPPAVLDARNVKKAIKGVGTDEAVLIEILCTRSDEELKATADAFKAEFKQFMDQQIAEDCGGDLKYLFATILKGRRTPPLSQIPDDVLRLHQAGPGKIGTNEQQFSDILGAYSRSYCDKLAEAYGKAHGQPLRTMIAAEIGGPFGRALQVLSTPLDNYFSERIMETMKGCGTDETGLLRLLCTLRDRRLRSVATVFLSSYQKSVDRWVADEATGDFKAALLAIIEHHGRS